MPILENIEKCNQDNKELLIDVQKRLIELMATVKPKARIEVYINRGEVERIIGASGPTVGRLVKDGLLSTIENRYFSNNKFLLSEVEWLKDQKYKDLNPYDLKKLLDKKERDRIIDV